MAIKAIKYLPSLLILTAVLLLLQFFSFYNIHKLKTANNTNDIYFALNNTITELKFDIADADAINNRVLYEGETSLLNDYELDITNAKNHIDAIEKNNPNEALKSNILELRILVNQYTDKHKEIIHLFTIGKIEEAKALESSENEEVLLDKIDDKSDLLQKRYIEFQKLLSNKNSKNIWMIQLFSLVLTLLISLYIAYTGYTFSKEKERDLQMQSSLKEAEQRAKKSAVIKEQFMANMSHEIRTPLNAIIGFTHRLQKSDLSDEQKQYIEAVSSSGENLLNIVNDILDFSKIEAGMLRLEEVTFNLPFLLDSVKVMFLQKANEKNIELKLISSKDIPELLVGDSYRLTQILMNLVGNAVKFTERGSIVIQASCLSKTDEKCNIEIRIIDSGIGISKEKLSLIFERFQQANLDTNRKYGGTGLGLSIVKQIVSLMQGDIKVESKENEGSTFIVNLPFVLSKDEKVATSRYTFGRTGQHPNGTNEKILIVEDNPLNLKLVEMLMKDWNVPFDSAENGRDAIEKLNSSSYQLILMDIQMPEMNGYETTAFLRNEMKLNTPIIAMTAHALEGEREKCLLYGMNDYTTKPIDEEILYGMMMKYMPVSKAYQKHEPESHHEECKINLDYINKLLHHDARKVQEILLNYLSDVPEYTYKLNEAVLTSNMENIKFSAHRLRSSVSLVGLDESAGSILHEIEVLSESNSDSNLIKKKFNLVKPMLEMSVHEVQKVMMT